MINLKDHTTNKIYRKEYETRCQLLRHFNILVDRFHDAREQACLFLFVALGGAFLGVGRGGHCCPTKQVHEEPQWLVERVFKTLRNSVRPLKWVRTSDENVLNGKAHLGVI